MRKPIVVQVAPYDLDSVQPRVETIREVFGRYLDSYKPKSTRSKHGIMGPVGKILSEARSGRSDADYLKGYVLRVHELSQRLSPSPDAVRALEEGINLLAQLLREAPITVRERLIDRIDYGLYFARRKKFLEWIEERNRDYRAWLEQSYKNIEALNRNWGTRFGGWKEIRYGGSQSGVYRDATSSQREDMERFGKHMRAVGNVVLDVGADTEHDEEII